MARGAVSHDHWSLRAALREAVKNVLLPSGRSLAGLGLSVLLGSALVLSAVNDDSRFERVLRSQTRVGTHTVVIGANKADEAARVSTRSCSGLVHVTGVLVAGPLQLLGLDRVYQLDTHVAIVATSTSLLPALLATQAIVGSALPFDRPRPIAGSRLARVLATPGVPLAGGIPADSAVVVRLDPRVEVAGLCVAVLDPRVSPPTILPALAASVHSSGAPVLARVAAVAQVDPIADYRDRPRRLIPLACAALLCLWATALLRFRASEIAAYRLSGTSKPDMMLILALEQVVLAGVFSSAALASIVITRSQLVSARAVMLWTLTGVCLWLGAFPVLAIKSAYGKATELAKDR